MYSAIPSSSYTACFKQHMNNYFSILKFTSYTRNLEEGKRHCWNVKVRSRRSTLTILQVHTSRGILRYMGSMGMCIPKGTVSMRLSTASNLIGSCEHEALFFGGLRSIVTILCISFHQPILWDVLKSLVATPKDYFRWVWSEILCRFWPFWP